jgi:hypothetical protein
MRTSALDKTSPGFFAFVSRNFVTRRAPVCASNQPARIDGKPTFTSDCIDDLNGGRRPVPCHLAGVPTYSCGNQSSSAEGGGLVSEPALGTELVATLLRWTHHRIAARLRTVKHNTDRVIGRTPGRFRGARSEDRPGQRARDALDVAVKAELRRGLFTVHTRTHTRLFQSHQLASSCCGGAFRFVSPKHTHTQMPPFRDWRTNPTEIVPS